MIEEVLCYKNFCLLRYKCIFFRNFMVMGRVINLSCCIKWFRGVFKCNVWNNLKDKFVILNS